MQIEAVVSCVMKTPRSNAKLFHRVFELRNIGRVTAYIPLCDGSHNAFTRDDYMHRFPESIFSVEDVPQRHDYTVQN